MSLSTGVSAQSFTQTALSLLGADEADSDDTMGNSAISDGEGEPRPLSPRRKIRRYFKPLWTMAYYRPLAHLLLINFFYALLAFVYLFAGTLVSLMLRLQRFELC